MFGLACRDATGAAGVVKSTIICAGLPPIRPKNFFRSEVTHLEEGNAHLDIGTDDRCSLPLMHGIGTMLRGDLYHPLKIHL
jgi:hypothetical protein